MGVSAGRRWGARRRPDGSWELVPPPRPKPRLTATEAARPKPPFPDDPRDSFTRNAGPYWPGGT